MPSPCLAPCDTPQWVTGLAAAPTPEMPQLLAKPQCPFWRGSDTKAAALLKDSNKDDLAQHHGQVSQEQGQCQVKDQAAPASKRWAHQALPAQGVTTAKSSSGLALAAPLKPLTPCLYASSKVCSLQARGSGQTAWGALPAGICYLHCQQVTAGVLTCSIFCRDKLLSAEAAPCTGRTSRVWVPAACCDTQGCGLPSPSHCVPSRRFINAFKQI